MVNPKVDELSMMTYLSMFPEAKLKEGAPIKASMADASKVKAYGPGLEPDGLSTDNARTEFTVDVKDAGIGKLFVSLSTPVGDQEIFVDDKRDGTFICSYLLDVSGQYVITILWAGQPIPGSPFPVNVAQGSDATACNAYGPGLEAKDLKEGIETEFWVETAGAGEGTLSLSIRGPKGAINEDLRVEDEGNGKYHVFYTPPSAGQYIIDILFGGLHIPESPYKVHVAQDRADASKCRAEGDGITGKGLEVGKRSYFWVYTQGAGRGDLSVHIRGKSGTVPVECTEKETSVYECSYLPEEDGEFVITVKYGGENIPGSRFKVTVEPPTDASKCIASGPGLEAQGVRVSIPTKFQVRTKEAGQGELEVAITGPDNLSLAYECECTPYVYDYTYEAKVPGMYKADIKFAGENIPGSPFLVAVTDTNKVKITGPGMNGEILPINEPLEYFVDARGAGPGKVGCSVQGPMRPEEYDQSAISVHDNEDGTFQITYTPMEAGRLKMNATFAELAIPETPIKLYVYDASHVFAEGKGLEDGNISGELTTFTVDMRKGGEGSLHVGIDGPANTPVTVKDQANNVVNCEYIPLVAGEYDVNILWEGVHIPNSPYHISVKPSVDASAVRVYGESLEPGRLFTDMWAEFFVDYKNAGKGQLEVKVTGPGGGEELECTEVDEGLSKFRFYVDPEEAGEYKVGVLFADQEVPGSPFTLQAAWKTDPKKVKAYGAGLEGGSTHQWAHFTVDRSKAGAGDLSLSIEGPCECDVKVDEQGEGMAEVKFLPVEPGEYKVHVTFADESIPGSPFTPVFEPCTDPSKVKAEGPGLAKHGVRVGEPADFVVDTTYAGPGALDVFIEGPGTEKEAASFPTMEGSLRDTPSPVGGKAKRRSDSLRSSVRAHITNNNDGTYNVLYTAKKVGQHSISVTYDGMDTPDSPFLVEVSDPSKVRMTGPGILDEEVYTVAEPLVYAVDTTGAGNGELNITINGPEGCNKEASIEQTSDTNYAVKFTPDKPGVYFLHADWSGANLSLSPVRVGVFDADKVVVSGDCFSGAPIKVGTQVSFAVDATRAGEGELGLFLSGPSKIELTPQKQDDSGLHFCFIPETSGDYVLDVKFAGKAICDSPFTVKTYDPTKVTASGPGITGEGARVGEPAPVVVDTSQAGSAPLAGSIKTPSGEVVPLEFQPQPEEGIYHGEYVPDEPGTYEVEITFDDEPIAEFPYRVNVGNPTAVKYKPVEVDEEVMAEWVDGVESASDMPPLFATVGQPCILDVDAGNAGPGKLGAQFKPVTGALESEGDIPVDVEFVETDTDQYQLHFTPLTPTDMDLQVLFNGSPISEPQRVIVSNPTACKAYGPGLESGLVANHATHFTVETKNAGPGKLACIIHNPEQEEVPFDMETVKGSNEYKVTYTPLTAGNYSVSVTYAKGPIENSPFNFNVCDPSAVRAYGAGLEAAIVNEEAEFTVDLSKAGDGQLGLAVEGPKKTDVQCNDNGDGTFRVTYTPILAGLYTFTIRFADMEIPSSPFDVRVERLLPDASKCTVQDIDTPGSFVLDASEAGGNGILEVCAYGAFMPVQYLTVTHNGDYTFDVKYHISEPGDTTISVKWHGVHIPGSPFIVHT